MSEGNLRPISRARSIVRSVCPHRSSSSLSTSIYFIVFIHYNYIIRVNERTWWKSGKRFRSKLPCFVPSTSAWSKQLCFQIGASFHSLLPPFLLFITRLASYCESCNVELL